MGTMFTWLNFNHSIPPWLEGIHLDCDTQLAGPLRRKKRIVSEHSHSQRQRAFRDRLEATKDPPLDQRFWRSRISP